MKVHIIFSPIVDLDDTNKMIIGGIQTYLRNLLDVLEECNIPAVLYQYGKSTFEIDKGNYKICGVVSKDKSADLVKKAEENADFEKDILIFGSSSNCQKNKFKHVISIQHGIYWDVPSVHGLKHIPSWLSTVLRCVQTLIELRKQKNANVVVCVDYNYVNWYRSQTIERSLNCAVIPNFVDTKIPFCKRKRQDGMVKIIFARRFEEYRGTELVVEPFKRVLNKYPHVHITFAGTGSQAHKLHEIFDSYEQVNFIQFDTDESVDVHSNYDIAIVPSIASEGTSLSLLEAMAAGCSVICTDVGGMTNIVLDGYNGLIIPPNQENLEEALERLITDSELREMLAVNGEKTAKEAFSLERWKKKWIKVIDAFIGIKGDL